MSLLEFAILGLYFLTLVVLAVFGFHRYIMVFLYYRHRDRRAEPLPLPRHLPRVTVQLPLYNEMYVVDRLVDSVCRIRYPKELLEIQVLDDSTDETTAIAAALAEQYRREGFAISLLHRRERTGYKAGALQAGLAVARGELLAIFDADSVPAPDFLVRTVPFFRDASVGAVQIRWGHINRDYSILTRTQALMMDGHFWVEQPARSWSRLFLTFNGSAGVWRRAAIEDAGGWQTDTLTEDLDLSYRAQLKGWRVKFLPQLACPAELPVQISAFKAQQRRWAKGSIQTAKKLLPRLLRADLPLFTKVEAVFHLCAYFVQPCMLVVALAAPILPWIGRAADQPVPVSVLFSLAAAGPFGLFFYAQWGLYPDQRRRLAYLPALFVFGTGLALNTTRAVFEALFNVGGAFVRTPKFRIEQTSDTWIGKPYRVPFGWFSVVEALTALYFAVGIAFFVRRGIIVDPFLALCTIGFAAVTILGLAEVLGALLHARGRRPPRRHGARRDARDESAAVVEGPA